MPNMIEVSDDDLTSLIGEGVHTGLRKGTDAEDAHDLWTAISQSNTTAWSDAVEFCVSGLRTMGFKVYREEE